MNLAASFFAAALALTTFACASQTDDTSSAASEVIAPTTNHCGGFAGFQCAEDEVCTYTVEEMCGAADHMGTCKKRPEVCIEIYAPVCGCDGKTYGNSCYAAGAGTSVAKQGECEAPVGEKAACGGMLGLSCADDEVCRYTPEAMCGAADATGTCEKVPQMCPAVYQPVCGCDGKTYSNACTAGAGRASIAYEGACKAE